MTSLVAAALVAASVMLAGRPIPAALGPRPVAREPADSSWLRRHRAVLAVLAGAGGVVFVGGVLGLLVAGAAAGTVWTVADRAEPAGVRQEREQARRELPHVVELLGAVLASGAGIPQALEEVASALPGPASDQLRLVAGRLALGAAPGEVWAEVAGHPGLAPLGRAMCRATTTGSAVAATVTRLGEDLSRDARADVEDRARAVGVRAALPLGLCLLPAFLLVGIVPVVASALASIRL